MKRFNKSEIFASADKAIETIVPYYEKLIESIDKEQNSIRTKGTRTLLMTTGSSVFIGLYELLKKYADILPKQERGRYAVAIEGLLTFAFNGGRVLGWEEQAKDGQNINEAYAKHESLDKYLNEALCGIGSNRTKRFLAKKIKEGDTKAQVLRHALDAEKMSIDLPKYQGSYKMSRTIGFNLDKECFKMIGMVLFYGYSGGIIRDDSDKETPIIAIAELPNGETVAFRCADDEMWRHIPKYEKSWDNDFNDNLMKIERNILELYQEEIKQRYPDSK